MLMSAVLLPVLWTVFQWYRREQLQMIRQEIVSCWATQLKPAAGIITFWWRHQHSSHNVLFRVPHFYTSESYIICGLIEQHVCSVCWTVPKGQTTLITVNVWGGFSPGCSNRSNICACVPHCEGVLPSTAWGKCTTLCENDCWGWSLKVMFVM